MLAEHRFDAFVAAQNAVFVNVQAELIRGRKETHWMWFIFPQLAGLGSSAMAQKFALQSLEEARAYVRHPILGQRLRACVQLLLDLSDRPIEQILGSPDDLKLRSSLTLFDAATQGENLFRRALQKYYRGERDLKTIALLDTESKS